MKTKIYITRNIPDEGIKMLKRRKSIKLDIWKEDKPIPRKELLKRVKGSDIVLSILTEKIDAKV